MLELPSIAEGIQSFLAPRGPHADYIATLSWVLFVGGGLILLLVVVLALIAMVGPSGWRGLLGRRSTVIVGGIAFPVVTLTALLVYGLLGASALVSSAPAALRVEVQGERWWWRVHYLDQSGETTLTTANEIRVPVDMPVEFRLTSTNVIHSFWVPSLAGKLDMIPGRVNVYRFEVSEPGIYRGQCAEYCGEQHAKMAFYVVAMPRDEFEAWYAAEAAPARDPVLPFHAYGQERFLANGCGACHRVRGTPADGDIGPDLTHVGGRVSLAAGELPNNVGTFAGWIASSQHIKPGNKMPPFDTLPGVELRGIAAYMESLK
jgi:cytochrome c oxidase subunit II